MFWQVCPSWIFSWRCSSIQGMSWQLPALWAVSQQVSLLNLVLKSDLPYDFFLKIVCSLGNVLTSFSLLNFVLTSVCSLDNFLARLVYLSMSWQISHLKIVSWQVCPLLKLCWLDLNKKKKSVSLCRFVPYENCPENFLLRRRPDKFVSVVNVMTCFSQINFVLTIVCSLCKYPGQMSSLCDLSWQVFFWNKLL